MAPSETDLWIADLCRGGVLGAFVLPSGDLLLGSDKGDCATSLFLGDQRRARPVGSVDELGDTVDTWSTGVVGTLPCRCGFGTIGFPKPVVVA